jgi:ammonia channel protein AmtB
VAWTVFGLWLSSKAHWPEAYGITHDCALRGCIFEDIVKSPALLQHPTAYSIALFAWFATMGAIVVGIVVHAVVRKPDFQHFATLALIAGALVVIYLSPQSALDW